MPETIESICDIKVDAIRDFLGTDFSIGIIWCPYETGRGVEYGQPHYYIKIAGIGFFISEESFNLFLEKLRRIREIAGMKQKGAL